MASTGFSPAEIATLMSALQGPDTSGITTNRGAAGGGAFGDFLSSPGAALLGQIVSGLGQGLLSGPSDEERELARAQSQSLGAGSANQNAQTFQQLMQLLLRSSGRGGL